MFAQRIALPLVVVAICAGFASTHEPTMTIEAFPPQLSCPGLGDYSFFGEAHTNISEIGTVETYIMYELTQDGRLLESGNAETINPNSTHAEADVPFVSGSSGASGFPLELYWETTHYSEVGSWWDVDNTSVTVSCDPN